jgi:hypothetical protein
MVVKEHPEVYRESVLGVGSTGPGPRIAAMRKLSDSLEGDLSVYLSGFQKAFPDFVCQNPIYFLVSLGAFDGGVRPVNDSPALLFGVDVIAKIHPHDELGALFDHELFHMYHRQITGMGGGRGDPLYHALWEERLATYVSGVLNPPSQRKRDSGSSGRFGCARQAPVAPKSPANCSRRWTARPRISIRVLAGKQHTTEHTAALGYFAGLLIARELGQSHSLQQLAKMNGESLRSTIRRMLQKMAH